MTRSILASALALAACAAPVDMSFDEDQDGLLSIDEVEIYGTDPLVADSDGDSHLDGDEVLAGTDPLDIDDYPYHAGWPIDGACRNDISGDFGAEEGMLAEQFALVSQHEDRVRLHDFCNQVVVLKRSAGWCGACRASEGQFVGLYEQFADRGFMAITMIIDGDQRGETPDVDWLAGYSDQYGGSHPVVVDDEGASQRYEKDGGIPTYTLIGPGMELISVDGGMPTAEDIEALLPSSPE